MAAVRVYGQRPDGRDVLEHTLDNGRGLVLRVIDHGGIVTALECADRDGRSAQWRQRGGEHRFDYGHKKIIAVSNINMNSHPQVCA